MNYDYYLEKMAELDPDVLVSDLGLTSEEIIEAFENVVNEYITKEFLD